MPAIAGFLVIYAVGCWVLARLYVHPGGPIPLVPQGLIGGSVDGIPAWISPGLAAGLDAPACVFILIHGFRGSRGSWQEAARDLVARGYEAAVPAMPGHEASPQPRCGFGPAEAEVVLKTVAWVRERCGPESTLVLVGMSLGGAACWLAAAMGANVDAVVTEGALTHVDETAKRWFNRMIPLGSAILSPVTWFARRLVPSKEPIDVIGAASKWRGKPALVIQGDRDRLIPMADARELAETVGCELWTVADARHAHCYRMARKAYLAKFCGVAESAKGRRT